MKTFHFICKIQDSINQYKEVSSTYCNVRTMNQAKKHFLKDPNIKKYIGQMRYQIIITQNSEVLQ